MQAVATRSTGSQTDEVSADTVLEVVRGLHALLHHVPLEAAAFGLDSRLDRDLGFDSLARVELLVRLEQRFQVELPERVLESADTVAALLEAVRAAQKCAPAIRPGPHPSQLEEHSHRYAPVLANAQVAA
ncbi:MAG TPA: acyl carrier protein [Steroidobacteraceae bacterium]|nr:acyl carrier protein [Steroidobacteraceae bacterium]